MEFVYLKALHLVFVVSWFAGLFYIVRLFIYHTESSDKPDVERQVLQDQFIIMEKRLWTIITWPAAILTTVFGYYMVYNLDLWTANFMIVKMVLTSLLWVYHIMNHRLYLKFQKNELTWTSMQLRLWNELAAMFLVAIIFVIVLRSAMNWIYGTIGFFVLGVVLMMAIRVYKQIRERKK